MNKFRKLPRLYINAVLEENISVSLTPDQTHYLKNVLRKNEGDQIRGFNGQNGEWLLSLQEISKKSVLANCTEQLNPQNARTKQIHLLFAPIKKARLDFLIEKATELGATHLHPVITEHTEARNLNEDRLRQQIIEAAEQCERLDLPVLEKTVSLTSVLSTLDAGKKLFVALERDETAPHIKDIKFQENIFVLIGPEGGFSEQEISLLSQQEHVTPLSLGSQILRAETAALKVLSFLCV